MSIPMSDSLQVFRCSLSMTQPILVILIFNISCQATFKPPKAIRGGIQICFPQVWSSSCYSQVMFPMEAVCLETP